jgi:hypothetical protein
MKRILRYLRARRFEHDLAAEIQAYVDEKIDELIAGGLGPEEARAQALRRFGKPTRVAEVSREQWAVAPLDEIGQDLRFALRSAKKSGVHYRGSVIPGARHWR